MARRQNVKRGPKKHRLGPQVAARTAHVTRCRSAERAKNSAIDEDELAARRTLMKYLSGVLEDSKVDARRKETAAITLGKVLSTAQTRHPVKVVAPDGSDKPAKTRKGYVSVKKVAEDEAKTAVKGTKWGNLVGAGAGAQQEASA